MAKKSLKNKAAKITNRVTDAESLDQYLYPGNSYPQRAKEAHCKDNAEIETPLSRDILAQSFGKKFLASILNDVEKAQAAINRKTTK